MPMRAAGVAAACPHAIDRRVSQQHNGAAVVDGELAQEANKAEHLAAVDLVAAKNVGSGVEYQ